MYVRKRKKALLIVAAIIILTTLACLGSGSNNDGGNTQQNANAGGEETEGPDIAATEAALAATQSFLETQAAEPPPATDTEEAEEPEPTDAPEEPEGIDWDNLQHDDVLYATDFDGPGDWEDGWFHFPIPDGNDAYDIWIESGYFYFGIGDKNTTVYAIYENVYVPREVGDMVVEAAFDNVGDVRTNNISIICRASADGWYEFSLGSDGLWFIWTWEEGEGYTLLANGGVAGYKVSDTAHVISAACIGDTMTFFIDGSMPKNAQVTDRTFREGQAGISVTTFDLAGVEVEWDWFQIWYP